jgi:hypothetical protein
MKLFLLDCRFAFCKFPPGDPVPAWVVGGPLVSITRTTEELSIVCLQDAVPQIVSCVRGWRCLQVKGPLAFSFVGVLASLISPMAEAGISVFALSTFDTDYLLLKEESLEHAIAVLGQCGHSFG